MVHDMPTDEERMTCVKGFKAVTATWRATAMPRAIILAPVVSALFLLPAKAEVTCWPVDKVIAAHAEQGDEIILTFRSWIQDGLIMIIYQDPSDRVVTEIAIYPNGAACLVNVGEELQGQVRRQSMIVPGIR